MTKKEGGFPALLHENVKGENPLEALIQAKNISKSFSGIPALRNISIDFYPGRR